MQSHIASKVRREAATTVTTDRRATDRTWYDEFLVTRHVVVLSAAGATRAALLNTSAGGIGIEVTRLPSDAEIGASVDVIYRGKRSRAEIRHITEAENSYRLGLQWKKVYSQ